MFCCFVRIKIKTKKGIFMAFCLNSELDLDICLVRPESKSKPSQHKNVTETLSTRSIHGDSTTFIQPVLLVLFMSLIKVIIYLFIFVFIFLFFFVCFFFGGGGSRSVL